MDAIDNLLQVKNNWSVCSRWEVEQQKKDACFEKLKSKINPSKVELSEFEKRGKTLVNAVNILDQIGVNKSENALVGINSAIALSVQILGILGAGAGYLFSQIRNHPDKTPKIAAFVGFSVFSLIGGVAGSFVSSHYAKTATRIARYQTRNNELKDVRNFVVYSDEQIKQAKEKISEVGEVKDITDDMSVRESTNPIKVYKKSLESIKILNNDYEKYKDWRKQYLKDEKENDQKLSKIALSADEKEKAQRDKNFILETIKKLEISSNNYEINVGFAIRALAAALSVVAVCGGFSLCWGLGRLSSKIHSNILSKIVDVMSKLSIPAGIAGMFLVAGPLLKLAKESANLGRFEEKEKLLSDAKNFYPYADNEPEKISKECKDKFYLKGATETVKDDFMAISRIKSDYAKFLKYKNGERKEELKLEKILKNMSISDKQSEDAKRLQKQVFMAFEKIDDKSECLVDDTNAAVSSEASFVNVTVNCISKLLTMALFGKEISKLTPDKKMPGFFEGLKLAQKLSFKKMALIFIVPYVVARGIMLMNALMCAEIKKKACKIGIMSALRDLDNDKKFAMKINN